MHVITASLMILLCVFNGVAMVAMAWQFYQLGSILKDWVNVAYELRKTEKEMLKISVEVQKTALDIVNALNRPKSGNN